MAVHYAKNPGIPFCATSVEEGPLTRTSKWDGSEHVRGQRARTTTRTETTTNWRKVDCKRCLSKRDG